MRDYLSVLRERVVVFDGATGTNLHARDLSIDDFGGPQFEGCPEILNVTRPDVIRDLHASFFDVGCDVVETNSFGAFSTVLVEYGIAERAYELSHASAILAREVADSYDAGRFVAGSLGPGTKMATLGWISFAELRDSYEVAARGLLDGGVDLFVIETCQDLLQAKAAMIGARRAMKAGGRAVPIQTQVTIETTGRMLLGTEIGAALASLGAMRPDVFGLNCATGPKEMHEHLRHLSRYSPFPISCVPNAGLPSIVDGQTHYDLTPVELADAHAYNVTELGVTVVGGCCGTTPEHLRQVVDRVRDLTPLARTPIIEPSVSSLFSAVPLRQETSYLVIGERTNANGSKAFRDALLEPNWDVCEDMAREQVREGSHAIDVCVDYVGRDGVPDMSELARRYAERIDAVVVLDSTEPAVVQAGLERLGARAIINSVNLEDGDGENTRFHKVLTLAAEFGAAVVCTCIDTEGQARTPEWKLRAARQIRDLAVDRYGLRDEDLLFDALALSIGTGLEESRGDGAATIEGIRLISEQLPECYTTLGLSNVSFGLNPALRHVINSVFLHECVEAGLTSAIAHAGRLLPLNRIDEQDKQLALDLIYDRRRADYDPLTILLNKFEGVKAGELEKVDRSGWPVDERLKRRIIDGDRTGLDADLDEALATTPALEILNATLLEGMKVVGDLFGRGEMQLPFVLQSAEAMKAAVAHLEPHMPKSADSTKGRIVLATVKGDVHDIGKNLVDIILTNNGYEVFNLGIKVPLNDMVQKAREVGADAIGMSGLLVKSTLIMRENLEELNEQGLAGDTPVILGGAALTRTYVERDLREVYDGRVFYGKDAFEGLHTLDDLMNRKRAGTLDADEAFGREAGGRNLPRRAPKQAIDPSTLPARSAAIAADNPVFVPPFLGSRVIKGVALDDIAGYLNETALFRNQWQYRPENGENDEDFKARIRPELRNRLSEAKSLGLLVPQVAYGYFAANGEGDDLVIWKDDDRNAEWMRFSLPRQDHDPHMCIADFVKTDAPDYIAFHVVTMGPVVSEHAAKLFADNKYTDYLHVHGLGVEMAEALAELWHRRIREEWGFADEDGPSIAGLFRQQYRGGRYSFGYPACPDLEDNVKINELLDAERIGVVCSEETSFQYQPEQTTSALICHHPQAKYFVA
ncbi:MAG TPA: methionine synthase [Acidimicrobiales bacterium]|nr:methionine synthase [Acidimicrobiales bacterium]